MKNLKFKFILPAAFIFMLNFLFVSVRATGTELIPCGMPVGIAVYSKGVMITEIQAVKDKNGAEINAAKEAGLKKGDVIVSVNGVNVNTNDEIANIIQGSDGSIGMTIKRNGKMFDTELKPAQTDDGRKAGIWVRDSTAGIGTVTWYNPDDNSFGALGHGISDSDTGLIISVKNGDVFRCGITGVVKGEKGTPGELNAAFDDQSLGKITKNTPNGIFGTIDPEVFREKQAVPVALKEQINEGAVSILCDADGCGVKEYTAEIQKIDFKNAEGKNFVIKITDASLIEKTGGIVQGMSGSPILQNGRIVGAVTHVFVNDPTRGYGIFIENMLSEVDKIN